MISAFYFNEQPPACVFTQTKTLLLHALLSFALAAALSAKTCREVLRNASGRIVQTIDRQKSAGGTVQAITRDASGRIIGTATTHPNAGGSAQTTYRDTNGGMDGTADTRTGNGSGATTQ